VVKFDLDRDGVVEQYHVTGCCEQDSFTIISCRPYDLRYNIPDVVPLRLVARDHAFDGISLALDGEDMFNQIDSLFRHDNNVMMLTTSPMFAVAESLKESIDLGRAECVIRPGVTYYIPDNIPLQKAIQQIPVQDVAAASGDNNTKMSVIARFLEMLIGVSQGESGETSPSDPRAPAAKTTLLLMQSGKRTDRCLSEWCKSLPDVANLFSTLMYQYMGETDYKFIDTKGASQSFPLKILADHRLRWVARRRSVTLTPEFALSRLQTLLQTYMGIRPLLLQGDMIAMEIWNRTVRASGEPQCEKFLMDPQQAPQLAARSVQMAMQQYLKKAHLDAIAAGEKKAAQQASVEMIKTLAMVDRKKLEAISGEPEREQTEALEAQQAAGQAPTNTTVPTSA
jgi:hypothetical protein